MVHVIGSASDTSVLPSALPDEFKQIVHARQNVVHEDDRIKHLVLVVSQLVEGDHGGISDLCQVFDSVVECSSGPHRRPDNDTETDGSGQSVEYPQKGFGLIVRSILVDRNKDIVVSEDRGSSEQGSENVGDDVERVVQVDGEEVFMLLFLKISPDALSSSARGRAIVELLCVFRFAQQSR